MIELPRPRGNVIRYLPKVDQVDALASLNLLSTFSSKESYLAPQSRAASSPSSVVSYAAVADDKAFEAALDSCGVSDPAARAEMRQAVLDVSSLAGSLH